MPQILERAAAVRMNAIDITDDAKRHEFAQHLTPPETASLAVSMFSELTSNQTFITCLDLGAGTGMLSAALHNRYNGHIEQLDAIESDPVLATIYDAEMTSIGVPHGITLGDALIDAPNKLYDKIILNPPYKKMAASDVRQALLPCRSANLYSAFIAIGLLRLADNGELVAIVPRSWMNGDYFEPFRRFALDNFSLDAMHIYGSRKEVFKDTNVLQETMIVRFSKRKQVAYIEISCSDGKHDNVSSRKYQAETLIDSSNYVVRVAPVNKMLNDTVSSLGLCPSTGKVVDFRCRDNISVERTNATDEFALLYPGNFSKGNLVHPSNIKKPQWFVANSEAGKKMLIQPGAYVVVKRFSAKEDRKRVLAYPILVKAPTAIENHLNFIHEGTPRNVVPLKSYDLAKGLATWLNTSFIDDWFRDVSGSTQVNACDIKAMPTLPLDKLIALGKSWEPNLTQDKLDSLCEELI